MADNLIQHIGVMTDGKFRPDNVKMFLDETRALNGKRVAVIFRKFREYKQRSLEENNYYWGVIVKMLADETGNDPETIHEVIKYKFLVKEFELKGRKFTGAASTAGLSTIEFEDLCSRIRMWASAELSIYLPSPNESPLDIFPN